MTKTLESSSSKQLFLDLKLDDRKNKLKPPLKWAGGKRWLVPHLVSILGKYSNHRLVEPFCGSLAITLSFIPKRVLLNDLNEHLINFYNQLKKGLKLSLEMNNEKEIFYLYREGFNKLIKENKSNTKEAAELFYYLNRTCYNGLCRFNNGGEFNVPFGKYKTINYVKDFHDYKEMFSKWVFTCTDFEDISIIDNDFIYVDPPYDVEFTKYSKEDFTWNDQKRLIKWLSKQSCPVVISNQATKRIVELYKSSNFELRFLEAPRMISCTGNRTRAKEVLAVKNV